tara:strand:- start:2975 stop:3520 length:546 start_codon:yes stop_codon:yes gene_type:complete
LEVTFLLSIAGSGLVIPAERLSESHPLGDAQRYPRHHAAFHTMMKSNFLQSKLVGDLWADWQMGNTGHGAESSAWDQTPDAWNLVPIRRDITVEFVVRGIRNALAHGNIYTVSAPGSGAITEIAMASKNIKRIDGRPTVVGVTHYSTTPAAFELFLREWLVSLARQRLTARDISYELEYAA